MADIEFNCPKCKNPLVVDEKGAFRQVKCPDCGEFIVIPYIKQKSDKMPISSPPLPLPSKCPKCGENLPKPDASFCIMCGVELKKPIPDNKTSPSLQSPVLKKCPNCGSNVVFPRVLSSGSPVPNATCGSCKTVVELADKPIAGCPKCGGNIPEPITRFCMKCGFELRNPESAEPDQLSIFHGDEQRMPHQVRYAPTSALADEMPSPRGTTTENTSVCPYCKNSLSTNAILCVNCGRYLITGKKVIGSNGRRDSSAREKSQPDRSITFWVMIFSVIVVIIFAISISNNVKSNDMSSPNGASAPTLKVISNSFDSSKCKIFATESTIYKGAYLIGQGVQLKEKIDYGPRLKTSQYCDSQLIQFQSKINDPSYSMTPFVEGFRKGYFDPRMSEDQIKEYSHKVLLEILEEKKKHGVLKDSDIELVEKLHPSQTSGNDSSYSSRYSETESGVTLSYLPPNGWHIQELSGYSFKCIIRPDRSAITFHISDKSTEQLKTEFKQKGFKAQEMGPFRSDYGILATRVKYFATFKNETHEVYIYFMDFGGDNHADDVI